jgi:hypothetical protein
MVKMTVHILDWCMIITSIPLSLVSQPHQWFHSLLFPNALRLWTQTGKSEQITNFLVDCSSHSLVWFTAHSSAAELMPYVSLDERWKVGDKQLSEVTWEWRCWCWPSGSMFHQNAGIYIQAHMALQPRTPTSTTSPPWEPQIS